LLVRGPRWRQRRRATCLYVDHRSVRFCSLSLEYVPLHAGPTVARPTCAHWTSAAVAVFRSRNTQTQCTISQIRNIHYSIHSDLWIVNTDGIKREKILLIINNKNKRTRYVFSTYHPSSPRRARCCYLNSSPCFCSSRSRLFSH